MILPGQAIMHLNLSKKFSRPLAVGLLGWVVLGLFLPLAAKADGLDDCLKDTTVPVNGQEQTVQYAKAYPEVCAALCYSQLSPDKKLDALTLACGKCTAIAAATQLSIFPDKASVIGVAIVAYTTAFCAKYLPEATLQAAKELACDKGPQGCCIENFKPATDGQGKIDVETCYKQPPIYYGDCYCIVNKAIVPPDENKRGRSTFSACEADCQKKKGRVDVTQGIGRYQAESEGAPQLESDVNVLCFKPGECATAKGVFTGVDSACPTAQGYCLAPEPVIQLSSPIMQQAQVLGIRGWVELMLRFAVTAALVVSAIMFVFGGFKYILGSSIGTIASAKNTILNSIIGLILTLTAVVLLNTLNPATARYDKLGIKMINTLRFAEFNWCKDYEPVDPGKPLKFGDSGDPPGQLLYSESKLETLAEDTVCGKEYYIEGFTGQRCQGQKCEEKGKLCMPCTKDSEIEECEEKTRGNACVKASIAGYINFADGRVPKNIELMAVCNWIQPSAGQKFGFKKAQANTPAFLKAQLAGSTEGDAGGVAFMWSGSEGDLQKLKTACNNSGGLRGIVLGLKYKDTSRSLVSCAIGGITSCATLDDITIITKNDCGNSGTSRFKAYADGGVLDEADMQEAFYCGSWIEPGGGVHPNLTSLVQPPSMWSEQELKAAISGDKGITCDFTLTDKNAPSNPGTALMSKCGKSYCPPIEPKCNE